MHGADVTEVGLVQVAERFNERVRWLVQSPGQSILALFERRPTLTICCW